MTTPARRAPSGFLRASAFLGLAMIATPGITLAETPSPLVLEDAERFAALLATSSLPSPAELQSMYLDRGTEGVSIFTPNRIESAENLARAIAEDPGAYRKAVELCLPAARTLRGEVGREIARVGEIVGESGAAPAFVVFGAGNSGGTADERGLVLGLEVICRQADSAAGAGQVLKDFVAHEMTHVYQARAGTVQSDVDLLRQSLVEGFADFVMERALGDRAVASADRATYGHAHEADLWRGFKRDVAAGRTDTEWLYRPVKSRPGQPADMGYWIGKRICEAYYDRAGDKRAAVRMLLELRDPPAILAESGYGAKFVEKGG